MASNAKSETKVGVFAVNTDLTITMWDDELARLTGVPGQSATGKTLSELFPDIKTRGLLDTFQRVLSEGLVTVLAPAFHGYLLPCPTREPSKRFDKMQQRATIAPLKDGETIAGALVTIEDVTARVEREQELAEQLASPDANARIGAAETLGADDAIGSSEPLVGVIGDSNWRVRRAAVKGLTRRAAPAAIAALLRLIRENHGNLALLNSALQVLAMSDIDVVEPLVSFLNDSDAGLRMQAALILGGRGDERAVSALTQALEDPDTNVRYHAIEALGNVHGLAAAEVLARVAESRDFFLAFPALDALKKIGDTRVAPRIVPLLADEMLRDPATEALGELGDESVIAPIAEVVNAQGVSAVAAARAFVRLHERFEKSSKSGDYVAELTRRAIQPAGLQNLLQALETARSQDLGSLATVLGWMEGAAVNQALTHLLGHPAARKEVLEALVRHGKPVIDLLVQQLASEDVEIRRAAIIALGRIGDSRATPNLVEVLSEDDDLKVVAADALAKIGDQRAFEPLIHMIDHPDPPVRQAIIGALNSLGAPAMRSYVMPLLDDPDPLVRESAVKIAGYFGYEESAGVLLDRCQDSDERVRRAAVAILPYVEDPSVVQALATALQGDTPVVRAAAATALGHVQGSEAYHQLLQALDDEDSWVRYFAARSLGRHGVPESLDVLASVAQNDPVNYVCIAAIEAMAEIGGPRAAQIIAPFTRADNIDVVRAAESSYRLASSGAENAER